MSTPMGRTRRSNMNCLVILPLIFLLFSSTTSTTPVQRRRSNPTSLTTSEQDALESTLSPNLKAPKPTRFFEVKKPISLPPNAKRHSTLVLQHDFGYTYQQPPVTAWYSPPSTTPPSKIVLEWSASCIGRQFDRIFGIWVAGVEILRSCTAEPRSTGIVWNVEKDVTRYYSLLSKPQTMAVYLGNLVDKTYTGVYHVNVSVHFYYGDELYGLKEGQGWGNPRPGFGYPADLILPISRNLPLNDGLWFLVENSTDFQSKEVEIPRNSYRALLEVYVSFHSSDEFWYTNPPDSYLLANNLTDVPGNGAFREVVVSVDGSVAGVIWPFSVIYTGGINPLLWRPISGIGSFDLPTYDIEITPFLGKLLDGKPHRFGFGVTDALDVWFVDANLHLWLDSESKQTVGKLISNEAPSIVPSVFSKFKGLDGTFLTTASRQLSSTGWVKSSHGKITTQFYQGFNYNNLMVFKHNGDVQVINQTIDSNFGVYTKNPSSVLYSEQVVRSFPLYMFSGIEDQKDTSYSAVANLSYGFNEKKFAGERYGFKFSTLENKLDGQGLMRVVGNLVESGIGSTQQMYKYESTGGCYFRNVSSKNYTILHDHLGESCNLNKHTGSWDLFDKWLVSVRRISLEDSEA